MKLVNDLNNKTILLTGAAGFIGANLTMRLMHDAPSAKIIGIDNLNDYYDPALKDFRLKQIEEIGGNWTFVKGDIADKTLIDKLFDEYQFDIVINLAAQAGVRYSITNPDAYIQSNLIGFYNILEACRHSYDGGKKGVEHLVYASSSSVYGNNKKVPYSTDDKVDNPISLYAATKKSNDSKNCRRNCFFIKHPINATKNKFSYFKYIVLFINGLHYNVHSCEAPHWTYIHNVVFYFRISEPRCH